MQVTRIKIVAFVLAVVLSTTATATTWFETTVKCPICGKQNNFSEPGSYGSYIYNAESRFQMLFWPVTDTHTWWMCRHCHFVAAMGDFNEVPAGKRGAIAKYLEGVPPPKLPTKVVFKNGAITQSNEMSKYTDVPVVKRLEIAEGVYKILGRDDEFWCRFERNLAFHADNEQHPPEVARAHRMKALQIAERMLKDHKNDAIRKETLVIAAAMAFFLSDFDKTRHYLKTALTAEYKPSSQSADERRRAAEYLDNLVAEFQKKLAKP